MRLGVSWGLGHTASLLLVGGSLALLGAQMPTMLSHAFELLVAVMVAGLGLRALLRALREGTQGTVHPHTHGAIVHTHAAPAAHLHFNRWALATRPLIIGLMHGLAGSGALTAWVLAELPTSGARLQYIALFGTGSIVGMGLLTGLAAFPLMKLTQLARVTSRLQIATGALSTAVGVWWGWASLTHLIA